MSLKLAALCSGKEKTREQMLAKSPVKKYDDGRTLQCHKDECDINKIMDRFAKTNTISHINKYQGVYADFSDFDFHSYQNKLAAGYEVFENTPAEIRREFKNDPQAFFAFVNDPANKDDLLEKLPALAKPGNQLKPQVAPNADAMRAQARASEPVASENQKPAATPPAAETPAGDA